MILPVFNPSADSSKIVLHNLKNRPRFLDEISEMCIVYSGKYGGDSRGGGEERHSPPKLEVVAVGGYNVSVAPKALDLTRLDTDVLKISNGAIEFMTKRYGVGYSFVVAQFGATGERTEKFHPLAYTGPQPLDGTAFFPGVHYHGPETHDYEEFDHALYLLNPAPRSDPSRHDMARKWEKMLIEMCAQAQPPIRLPNKLQRITRRFMNGSYRNEDISMFLNPDENGVPDLLETRLAAASRAKGLGLYTAEENDDIRLHLIDYVGKEKFAAMAGM